MNWRAAWTHARAAGQAGDLDVAARAYDLALTALQEDPDPPDDAIARIMLERGLVGARRDAPDARDALELALSDARIGLGADHPALAAALVTLGRMDERDGLVDRARERLQRAIRLADSPGVLAEALSAYASFAWNERDVPEAAGALRDRARLALQEGEADTLASFRRAAAVYAQAGMLGDAIQTLDEAQAAASGPAQRAALLVEQAEALDRAGRTPEAVQRLELAADQLRGQPDTEATLASTLEDLAEKLAHLGRFDQVHPVAREALRVRLQAFPDEPTLVMPAHRAYARCLELEGDHVAAQEQLAWALACSDGEPQPRWTQMVDAAAALATTADHDEARHALRLITWMTRYSADAAGRARSADLLRAAVGSGLPGWVAGGVGVLVRAGEPGVDWEPVAVELTRLLEGARPYVRFLEAWGTALDDLPVSARARAADARPRATAAYEAIAPACSGLTALLAAAPAALEHAQTSELARLLADSGVPHPDLPPLIDLLHTHDDPEILVIHPQLKRGFQVRAFRVLHVQQLLVLLSAQLSGPHLDDLPGEPPSDEEVSRASGTALIPHGARTSVPWAAFAWAALTFEGFLDDRHGFQPDTRVRDLPRLAGRRVILLDETDRGWDEQLPVPPVHAVVERVHTLHGQEVDRWLERIRDARETEDFAHVEGARLQRMARTLRDEAGAMDLHARALVLARAVDLHRRLIGPDRPETLELVRELADVSLAVGDVAVATQLRASAFDIVRREHGPTHPEAIAARLAWADAAIAAGEAEGARAVLERTLRMAMTHPGPAHAALIGAYSALARCAQALGDHATAVQHQEQVVSLLGGSGDPEQHGAALTTLARLQADAGQIAEASSNALFALEAVRRAFGEHHPRVAEAFDLVADCFELGGEVDQAVQARLHARDIRSTDVYAADADGTRALVDRVRGLLAVDRPEEAADLGLRGLPALHAVHGPNGPTTRAFRELLMRALYASGRTDDAIAVAHDAVVAAEGDDDLAALGETLCNLGDLLTATGAADRAVAHLVRGREAAAQAGADDIEAAACLRLGTCYASLGRLAEAEAVLAHALDWQHASDAGAELTDWTAAQLAAVRAARGEG